MARSVESGVQRTSVGRMVALWVLWWYIDLQGLVLPKLSFLVRESVWLCVCIYVSACLKSARSLSSSRVWRNLVGVGVQWDDGFGKTVSLYVCVHVCN